MTVRTRARAKVGFEIAVWWLLYCQRWYVVGYERQGLGLSAASMCIVIRSGWCCNLAVLDRDQ